MTTPNVPQFPVPESPHTDLQFRDIYRRLSLLEQTGVGGGGAPGEQVERPAHCWARRVNLYLKSSATESVWAKYSVADIGRPYLHQEFGCTILANASWHSLSPPMKVTLIGTAKNDRFYEPQTGFNRAVSPLWRPTDRSNWAIWEGIWAPCRWSPGNRVTGPNQIFTPWTTYQYLDPLALPYGPAAPGIEHNWQYYPINPLGSDNLNLYVTIPQTEPAGHWFCIQAVFWGRYVEFEQDVSVNFGPCEAT